MSRINLTKPLLVCFYGYPGSGKTYVARNLSLNLGLAYVGADRIRTELFEHPRYDAQENAIVESIMRYMAVEFLNLGVSVAFDSNSASSSQRRTLRNLALKAKAEYMLIWLQIDEESAFSRTQSRDRRTSDDKYAEPQTKLSFDKRVSAMQNPQNEDYMVISGKHSFSTQKNSIISRLYKEGLLSGESVRSQVAKPDLVNLVPNPQAGRVDMSRRNITIR